MIKANFKAYGSYVTDSLYQWDKNRTLSVTGITVSVSPEVHFTNAILGKAIVKQGTLSGGTITVDIPNSLLQEALSIRAYIGVYEGSTFKTLEVVEIPVIRRARPEDYTLDTGDEVYSFKALENALANKADSDKVNARIDNIIAHNNDTEGNTELVDGRVGSDGTIYGSVGEAIRNQVDESKTISSETIIEYIDVSEYNTGYIDTTGETVALNSSYVSDYFNVEGDTRVEYSIDCLTNIACGIAVYDYAKNLIDYVGSTGSTGGQYIVKSGVYILPSTAKYIRFSMSKGRGSASESQYIKFFKRVKIKEILDNVNKTLSDPNSQWRGKKWIAFGTSITDTSYVNAESGDVSGKYVPYLVEKSGLVVTNCAIAGGTIAKGGVHGATGNILTRILETDISDADLITIEGFVNDFACAVSIGDIGDTESSTICGALWQAITYCLQNSRAKVVLLTETFGRKYTSSSTGATADYSLLKKNSIDLCQQDYNEAIKKMGALLGCHVIDAGQKSQINEYHSEFLIDQIHHSELGGKQYATTIWEELKHVAPLCVSD